MQRPSAYRTPDNSGRPRFCQAEIDQLVAAHERFQRGQPKGRRAILRFLQAQGIDFSRRLLSDADFTGSDMRGAKMVETNLERANLYCCDLRSIDGRGMNLRRAELRGCSLRLGNLTGALLDGADMREALLVRADAAGGFAMAGRAGASDGMGSSYAVDFSNCSMKDAKLGQAKLKGANFSGAMMKGADLKGASLEGAIFHGAVLVDADLTNARIDSSALVNCVMSPSQAALQRIGELRDRLAGAQRWVATNGAEGRPARLDGEDLRTLKGGFENARMTAMSAKGAVAVGVSFRGAALQGANFDEADLRDADFTGADLRGTSFKGAKLFHALFDKADMRALALPSGSRAVDLEGATHSDDAFATAIRV